MSGVRTYMYLNSSSHALLVLHKGMAQDDPPNIEQPHQTQARASWRSKYHFVVPWVDCEKNKELLSLLRIRPWIRRIPRNLHTSTSMSGLADLEVATFSRKKNFWSLLLQQFSFLASMSPIEGPILGFESREEYFFTVLEDRLTHFGMACMSLRFVFDE